LSTKIVIFLGAAAVKRSRGPRESSRRQCCTCRRKVGLPPAEINRSRRLPGCPPFFARCFQTQKFSEPLGGAKGARAGFASGKSRIVNDVDEQQRDPPNLSGAPPVKDSGFLAGIGNNEAGGGPVGRPPSPLDSTGPQAFLPAGFLAALLSPLCADDALLLFLPAAPKPLFLPPLVGFVHRRPCASGRLPFC